MKPKPIQFAVADLKHAKKLAGTLDSPEQLERSVSKPRPGRDKARRQEATPLRELADDEPIPFELLQEVVKEVWGIDLPVNFGFEQECPLYEPPEVDPTTG